MDTFTHTLGDGTELRFAHLSLHDVFGDPDKPEPNGFVPVFRKRLKDELVQNLKTAVESGFISKEQGLTELCGFDDAHRKMDPLQMFLRFIRETTGASLRIVRFAFAKANEGKTLPDDIPASVVDEAAWTLLAPFEIVQEKQPEPQAANTSSTYGDGGTDPNREPPPTYSSTETSGGGSGGSTPG